MMYQLLLDWSGFKIIFGVREKMEKFIINKSQKVFIILFSLIMLTSCIDNNEDLANSNSSIQETKIEYVEVIKEVVKEVPVEVIREVIIEVPVETIIEKETYPSPKPSYIAEILTVNAGFDCTVSYCTKSTSTIGNREEILDNVFVTISVKINESYDLVSNTLFFDYERIFDYEDYRATLPRFPRLTYDHSASVYFETFDTWSFLTKEDSSTGNFELQTLNIKHGESGYDYCTDSFSELCNGEVAEIRRYIDYYFELFEFYGVEIRNSKLNLLFQDSLVS